jgi:predicted phage tail protein
MRKVYLEGILGEKFGAEWNLAVTSPAEAMQAIAAQRPGFKQFLIEGENIQGYDVLVGDEQVGLNECMLVNPSMDQSYTFAPVIAGSKNSMLLMIAGIALIWMTGGAAAFGMGGLMGGGTATVGAAALPAAASAAQITAVGTIGSAGLTMTQVVAFNTAGLSATAGLALSGASYLGMGLLLGGASMLLAPDVPDGSTASKAKNYLFSGPVNTVKQGAPIPLIYGRIITGSATVMGSLFTNSSSSENNTLKTRKLVGIGNFRDDGGMSGGEGSITGRYGGGAGGRWGYYGPHGGQEGGEDYA